MKAFATILLLATAIPYLVHCEHSVAELKDLIQKDIQSRMPKALSVCSNFAVQETRSKIESIDNVLSVDLHSDANPNCVHVVAHSSAINEIDSLDNLHIESISEISLSSYLGPEDDDYSQYNTYLSAEYYFGNDVCSGDYSFLAQFSSYGPVGVCSSFDSIYAKVECETEDVQVVFYNDSSCTNAQNSVDFSTTCNTSSSSSSSDDDPLEISFKFLCTTAPSEAEFVEYYTDDENCTGSYSEIIYYLDSCFNQSGQSAQYILNGTEAGLLLFNYSSNCTGEAFMMTLSTLDVCNSTTNSSSYYAAFNGSITDDAAADDGTDVADDDSAFSIVSSSIGFITLVATSLMILMA